MRDKEKMLTFGRNLCAERHRKGLSQDELGALISIDGSYIGKIERAEVNPTLTTILLLMDALKINFDDLYKR